MSRLRVTEMEDKESAVRSPAVPAKFGLCLENHRPHVCRAEASRFGCLNTCSLKRRRASLSAMTTGRQSKKMKRISPNEESTKVAVNSLAKSESVLDTTL